MELEQSDQEQVEALQRWWRENWLSLFGGLVLGLGGILGWQYYGEVRLDKSAAASQTYEAIKAQLVQGQLEQARSAIDSLQDEHKGSPYVTQARLALAQAQVQGEDWAGAEQTLRAAAAGKPDQALAGLIQLRLARVLWAQGKADEALAELKTLDGAYAPLALELRGDIALAKNDSEAARTAYEAALASGAEYLDRASVQRKLDALN